MKTDYLIGRFFTLSVFAGLIAGCASNNYKESAHTATTLNRSANLIARCNILIDVNLGDLNDLVSNPKPDLRGQFQKFSKDVEELRGMADDLAKKATEMRTQGADYFAQWDKEAAQIQNEDIRNRSEARKAEVATRFNTISQHYDDANTAFRPFLSDLHDVQTALSTDLTVGGLGSIKDTVAKANQDSIPVKESLSKLSDEFRSLGLSMSPINHPGNQ